MNPHPDIVRDFARVAPELLRRAAAFQPAILADVAGRRRAARPLEALRHRGEGGDQRAHGGSAAGDNLMIHAAIALAQPGDVLVIDGKGDRSAALMGTIMMNACRQVGIAGVVIDGAVRDSVEIDEMDFPVFSVGTNPNGPTKLASGRIGHPVSVGGVAVRAGDLVIGDADGVVVVEREKVETLLRAAQKKVEDEAARIEAIRQGHTAASWLDAALRNAGVLEEGETLA